MNPTGRDLVNMSWQVNCRPGQDPDITPVWNELVPKDDQERKDTQNAHRPEDLSSGSSWQIILDLPSGFAEDTFNQRTAGTWIRGIRRPSNPDPQSANPDAKTETWEARIRVETKRSPSQ